MATLYRKYRPQTFGEIAGQAHIKITLLNELVSGRIAHAYLFSGPRGVGKTTVARLFAKAVNCLHPDKDGGPDNTCPACVEIREGHSMDMIEIDAASHTGVDHVREHIIENARFTPSRWKYKVFIIDEVHMLSLSAFNALLKTLEEPPAHALFILATTEIHKIPETIISRCQRFDFRQLRPEDLIERLRFVVKKEQANVDDDVIEAIARFARGSARDAENLLGQVLTLGEKHITLDLAEIVLPRSDFGLVFELFDALARKDASEGVKLINRLVTEGVNLSQFVQNAIEFFRKALLLKVSSQLEMFTTLELPKEDEVRLLQLLEGLRASDVQRMIEVFFAYEQELRVSFIPQLPLEMAVLELTIGTDPVVATVTVAPPIEPTPLVPVPSTEPKKIKKKKAEDGERLLSINDVQANWGAMLSKVKSVNQSLTMTLKVSVPRDVRGTVIILGVGYPFHQERLTIPTNRSLLAEIFSDILGTPVTIDAEIVDELASQVPNFEREANVAPVAEAKSPESPPVQDGSWDSIVKMFTATGASEKH